MPQMHHNERNVNNIYEYQGKMMAAKGCPCACREHVHDRRGCNNSMSMTNEFMGYGAGVAIHFTLTAKQIAIVPWFTCSNTSFHLNNHIQTLPSNHATHLVKKGQT